MQKIIHVCFCDSACGCLKYALKSGNIAGNKVINLSDDLSCGPIYGKVNMGDRINWWRKIIKEDVSETIDYYRENYYKFHKNISKITNDDTVYFWVSNSAIELCGLMYTLEKMNITLDNAYIINVSNITYNKGKVNEFTPRCVGEITHKKLSELINTKSRLDESKCKSLLDNWKKLKEEKEMLRVYKDNGVINVNEDYFDKLILEYTTKEFRKCARALGCTLGYSEQKISDEYIFWRIQELIKKEALQYRGNFKSMRQMEIRKVEG